jgi:hypothetical protein
MSLLGLTIRDKISGKAGVVTGFVQYLTGCNQVCVTPNDPSGNPDQPFWLDVQRIVVDEKVDRILLDNGETPGPGPAPPRAVPPRQTPTPPRG